jgi:hypothetical protein
MSGKKKIECKKSGFCALHAASLHIKPVQRGLYMMRKKSRGECEEKNKKKKLSLSLFINGN